MTAGGVQVKIRYYTRACVRIGEFVYRPHFKVLKNRLDDVLGLPWLRSWKERNADV